MRIFDDNWGLRISTVTQDQVGYSKSPNYGVLNQLELTEEKDMHSANLPSCAQWNKYRVGET